MSTRTGRMVWRAGSALGKVPWVCWPDVVMVLLPVTQWRKPDHHHPADAWRKLIPRAAREVLNLLRQNGTKECRDDAGRCGVCYCGKFQTEAFQAEHVPAHYRRGVTVPEVTP